MSKKKKNKKKVESSSEEENSSSEDEKAKSKKLVGKKRKASSSSSSEDNSSEDEKPKKEVKRQRTESISSRTRSHSDVVNNDAQTKSDAKPKPMMPPPSNYKFQRINEDKFNKIVNFEKEGASFESKAKFGGEGDKFGEWSYERLRDKRGESFKKEKGKMKNRNFHSAGNRISNVVNSYKF